MEDDSTPLLQRFNISSNLNKIFITIIVVALVGGITTGYVLASSGGKKFISSSPATKDSPKHPSQDKKTFRDFAEGVLEKKPEEKNPSDYSEGTHILIRENAVPVALTSSVIDLSKYEGKKIKVYGETQKAIKEGWLMDVGMIEEIK